MLILLAVLLLPYLVTPFYRTGHPVSALMAWRWITGAPVARQWIDFNAISPTLPRTVVGSEDAKFCSHRGVDWSALQDAIYDAEDGEPARGGSTITQQVTKNLFLWPGQSWIRKGLEAYFTLVIETFWSKTRILEVYLNVAEIGPGVFGVGAASEHFFRQSAARLNRSQSALLAAVLPNPTLLRVNAPSRYVRTRQA